MTSLRICTRIMLTFCSNLLPSEGTTGSADRARSGAGTLGIRTIQPRSSATYTRSYLRRHYLFLFYTDLISSIRDRRCHGAGCFDESPIRNFPLRVILRGRSRGHLSRNPIFVKLFLTEKATLLSFQVTRLRRRKTIPQSRDPQESTNSRRLAEKSMESKRSRAEWVLYVAFIPLGAE